MYLLDLWNVSLFWLVCESLPSHSIYKKWRDVQTLLSKYKYHTSVYTTERAGTYTHSFSCLRLSSKPSSHEANAESLLKVPSARIFFQLEKTRFSKYMEWWLALQCFWLISLVIFVNAGDFFRPAPSRFPPLLSMFHWTLDWIRFSQTR